ncbi:hypothetical protein T10_2577 [Trichinella papuae]|uniref:Transmembrane protein n=1 Tax=Trichinella papuae TaxID=268474 RepID=A0A0V1MZC5_9BILA|nr:hypothetical protein T10_2577 [Trichinella papuae]
MSEGCVHVEDFELTNSETKKKLINNNNNNNKLLKIAIFVVVIVVVVVVVVVERDVDMDDGLLCDRANTRGRKRIKTVRLSFNYVIGVEIEKQEVYIKTDVRLTNRE